MQWGESSKSSWPDSQAKKNSMLFLIPATPPAQLVAYHMSVARGIDPDFPRNLSKTLTVD
jgi:glucosamine 6-phosphate synthetase-like amidotransferase/phosphosugar isomerase protein